MTISEDAVAFDRHLDATAPAVVDIVRALRLTVLDGFPGASEWFDRGDGLLAFGRGRSMRDFLFAIIPHKSHVNLQLADGVELPNPDGRIEGSGKRIRHVKVRSDGDASADWVRAVVAAQLAHRADDDRVGGGRPSFDAATPAILIREGRPAHDRAPARR